MSADPNAAEKIADLRRTVQSADAAMDAGDFFDVAVDEIDHFLDNPLAFARRAEATGRQRKVKRA